VGGPVEISPAPLLTGNSFGPAGQLGYPGDGTSRIDFWGVQGEIGEPSSYIPAPPGYTATRPADLLRIVRVNGTYDIEIVRESGSEVLVDQVASDGTLTIPTSVAPVIRVVTTRK
jgi:hypothetical protein